MKAGKQNRQRASGGSAVVGPSGRLLSGVTEEARTRSFAAPAFAGCANYENGGWIHCDLQAGTHRVKE
jgi:hypothetical protein